jgi:hypothetical protein
VTFDEEQRWVIVARDALTVVVNMAPQARRVPLPPGSHTILASYPPGAAVAGVGAVQLPAGAVAVLGHDDLPAA